MEGARSEIRPPSRFALIGEARIAIEWASMRISLASLSRSVSPGSGEPVLVAPGFATDDAWTVSLRRFVGNLGYTVRGWGLGRNHGRVPELIPALVDRTGSLADELGQRVRLVGWSLGGYLVREVARERPDLVAKVLTLGAPVVGGPAYTASGPLYARRGYDLEAIAAEVERRAAVPIVVPVEAIYSRSDGIVAWRACIDRCNPEVRHHEVRSSHLGLVASPAVYRLLARLLP